MAHWSGIETFCQDVVCPVLPTVLNGHIEPEACTQLAQEYGVICTINCKQGFELIGPMLKQCSNTGLWTFHDLQWACVGKLVVISVYYE